MARAIAVRCFWPPESVIPRSPTIVSYPAGKPSISPASPAISAARLISSALGVLYAKRDVLADGRAEEKRLLRYEPDQPPQFRRIRLAQIHAIEKHRASAGSISRGTSEASVLLPDPVWPTTATVAPAGIRRSISASACRSAIGHRYAAKFDFAAR